MRENNAELRATVYMLDRERETLELKIAALQSQLQAYVYVKTEEQVSLRNDRGVGIIRNNSRFFW